VPGVCDYRPDQDPEIILLRLSHRRAELLRWQVIARRWWVAFATLLTLYNAVIFLGLPDNVEMVAGLLTLISGIGLGFWHNGISKGTELRHSIEEAEHDHLAALRRAEHEAAEEQAADVREAEALAKLDEPVPMVTTGLLLPMRRGEVGAILAGSIALTEVVTARAMPLH
jgi:hypothetical protein